MRVSGCVDDSSGNALVARTATSELARVMISIGRMPTLYSTNHETVSTENLFYDHQIRGRSCPGVSVQENEYPVKVAKIIHMEDIFAAAEGGIIRDTNR